MRRKHGAMRKSLSLLGDDFVERKVSPKHRRTVNDVRVLMRTLVPDAAEVIAYGTLGWKKQGILAVINPTQEYISLVFLHGAKFEDQFGMLEGRGKVRKLVRIKDTDFNTNALCYYIRQAVKWDEN